MRNRISVSFALTALLASACTSGREEVSSSSATVGTSVVGTGTGGSGGAATGAGGQDPPVTSVTTSTGVGGAGGAGQGGAGGVGGSATTSTGQGGEGGGVPATCSNGVPDAGETDLDCGGPDCAPCVPGQICLEATDCDSLVCGLDGLCAEPACDDLVKNGSEGDIDCGAVCPTSCVTGAQCNDGLDCESGSCQGGVCVTPSCSDGVTNGDETSIDCGGPTCPDRCGDNQGCQIPDDCTSDVCENNLCSAASCSDTVRNGDESDVDCGGVDCTSCGAGKFCGAAADCTSGICTNGTCRCPSGMTTVPVPGGGSYCMDPTEVTYNEYNTFVTGNPQNTIPGCAFNQGGYTPSSLWPPSSATDDPNYLQRPVRYVDWCDAAMYCEYRGKRLCGAIEGGPVAAGSLALASVDQWFNACTSQGTNDYPYGDAFNSETCTESVGDVVGVPSAVRNAQGNLITSCQGGVSGIYQMSGNLAEWEDSCSATIGASDLCVVRGGSYLSTDVADLRCDDVTTVTRSTTAENIGIRCCQ